METTVGIQDAYSYAVWPMFALVAVIVGLILTFFIAVLVKKLITNRKPKKPKIVKPQTVNLLKLKSECFMDLDVISRKLVEEKITLRDAYQLTSARVRKFVNQATGINVQNYTLEEIQTLRIPQLEELIKDYYSPEFAWNSVGDFAESMEKTKRVIEQWK